MCALAFITRRCTVHVVLIPSLCPAEVAPLPVFDLHTDLQLHDENTTKVIYNRKSRLTTLWETSPRTPASRSRCAFSFSFLQLSPNAQRLGRIPSILFRLSFFSFVHFFTLSCLLEGNRRSKEGKSRNLRLEQGKEQ
jgi:hypothetical protein